MGVKVYTAADVYKTISDNAAVLSSVLAKLNDERSEFTVNAVTRKLKNEVNGKKNLVYSLERLLFVLRKLAENGVVTLNKDGKRKPVRIKLNKTDENELKLATESAIKALYGLN